MGGMVHYHRQTILQVMGPPSCQKHCEPNDYYHHLRSRSEACRKKWKMYSWCFLVCIVAYGIILIRHYCVCLPLFQKSYIDQWLLCRSRGFVHFFLKDTPIKREFNAPSNKLYGMVPYYIIFFSDSKQEEILRGIKKRECEVWPLSKNRVL